jgi:hypothetical protein
MPYIKPERRAELKTALDRWRLPANAGDLNFVLTTHMLEYLKTKGESYQTYCELEGVLGHMSKELYRRRVASYEDDKIGQNGDVDGFRR